MHRDKDLRDEHPTLFYVYIDTDFCDEHTPFYIYTETRISVMNTPTPVYLYTAKRNSVMNIPPLSTFTQRQRSL